MGWFANFQIFRPLGQLDPTTDDTGTGFLNDSGTPSLLADLSASLYQAQWKDLMQGGLDKGQFDFRLRYEGIDTVSGTNFLDDTIFGNWLLFGCLGAALETNASSGASALTISGLQNQQLPAFNDLIAGDLICVTDGVNSELFNVDGIVGNGPTWTLNLKPAWANLQIATQTTLVADAAQNSTSITVKSANGPGGALSAGQGIVIGADPYTISAGYSGGTNVPVTPNLTANYSEGTPISLAAPGATSIDVLGAPGVPDGATLGLDYASASAEQVTVSSKPGAPVLDISGGGAGGGLQYAHGAGAPVVFEMSNELQNNYQAGSTIITRVQYSGYLLNRIRSTKRPDQFSITAEGFFARYNSLVDSSTIQEKDSGNIMRKSLASYGATLSAIIVNDSTPGVYLSRNTSILVNVQETDVQFSEFLDTILRQENGNSIYEQLAVWVGPDRQVRHLPISTEPVWNSNWNKNPGGAPIGNPNTPTYFMTYEDQSAGAEQPSYGDTIDSVQMTDMDGTNLMNAAVVTGTTAPDGSSVYNANTTTLSKDLLPGATTMQVTSVPSTWPHGGSGLWILIDRGQSIDSNSQFVSVSGENVTIASGFPTNREYYTGDKVEMVTKLVGSHSAGDQNFAVHNAAIFSSGQEITFTTTGTSETLTIESIDYTTNVITTTTACHKAHSANDIACLAANGSGQGPLILAEQGNSIGAFGWYEGVLSSEDIYEESKLAAWAAKQLALLAWPVANAEVMLSTTAARITGRDLVSIGPDITGNSLIQNAISVQYNMTAADMNISATLELGTLRSTGASTLRNIAKERSRRQKYHIPKHHSNKNMMVHGHTINDNGGGTVTIDAGTVQINGQTYQIPAATFTVGDGESRWGASCGPGVATPVIVELPKRNWNGRNKYSHSGVYVIYQQGDQPQKVASFTGIPLWKVSSRDGAIVGWEALFEQRGVGLENLPSSSTPAAPSVSGFTPSAVVQSNGIAGDLALTGTVLNFPTDGGSAEMKFYVRTTGTTAWQHKLTVRAAGLPQPSVSQSVATVLHGLPVGQTIDVGLTFDGFNGEGAITVIIAAYSMPSSAAVIQVLTTLPTAGTSTPTPLNAQGCIGLCTASGIGVQNRCWVYDAVAGWQPWSSSD